MGSDGAQGELEDGWGSPPLGALVLPGPSLHLFDG